LTNRDEQSHINQYTETPALTGAANRNQTSEFFANQSSLRTYYGDFLVNFDYDLTDDLSLKANVGSNMQDRRFNITSKEVKIRHTWMVSHQRFKSLKPVKFRQ
jgi:hypothetical protein